jgi:hypothetical protein
MGPLPYATRTDPCNKVRENRTQHLHAMKPVQSWLRPAFARRMLDASWNVETARSNAGRLKDVPEPPTWADGGNCVPGAAGGCCRR